MTFHRLFFAAAVGLAGAALLVVGLWSGYAALGTEESELWWLALGLAVPGLVLVVAGYRWMNREIARGEAEGRADDQLSP